jgi:hypothetical protein
MQMYIRASILSASLIATVTCIGQQSPTSTTDKPTDACPISITNINPTGSDSLGHGLMSGNAHANDGRMFVLKVKNASGKDIRGGSQLQDRLAVQNTGETNVTSPSHVATL